MTREDLENLVVQSTGRSDKTSLIRTALNLAVAEVSSRHLWSDLQTEAEVTINSGEGSVELAADVARIAEIRVIDGTNSRSLLVRPKTWLVQRCPDAASRSTSRPTYGYLEGRTLHVIPWSDTTYTIRYTYFKLHPTLDTNTSEVLIRHAEQAVVAYATYWVFKSIEKHEDAQQWLATSEALIMSAKKIDQSNSVVLKLATPRDEPGLDYGDYWLDPFVQKMP